VHDKFHISKYLNEAVDQVRRTENKALRLENDDRLVGSKQLWLFKPANLSRKRRKELDALKKEDLKTSRAWAIKGELSSLLELRLYQFSERFL
jgi:transposase